MALFAVNLICQDSYETTVDLDFSSSRTEERDPMIPLTLAVHSTCSHDFLDHTFPSDEAIVETMSFPERPR